MYAVPEPAVSVTVALLEYEYEVFPKRTRHVVVNAQAAPIVSTVPDCVTVKSLSCDAERKLLVSTLHTPWLVQPCRFAPTGASVLKYISPTAQFDGSAVPDFSGRVDAAPAKSMLLACVRRSTSV